MSNKRLQTILETAENLMEYLVDEKRIEQWRKREEEEKREDAEIERRARENLAKRRNVSPESLNYDDEEFEYEYEMTKGEYKRQKREAARAKKAQEEAQREAERKKLPFGERGRINFDPIPRYPPRRENDDILDEIESSFERKSFDDWKRDREAAKKPIDYREIGSLLAAKRAENNPQSKIPSKVPGSNSGSGLLGAGSSVSGYDSTRKPGGLFGAGSSVSGYGRPGAGDGFDKVPYNPKRPGYNPYRPEPTPDIGPGFGKRPYPRLPPSKRPDIGPGDGSYTPTPKRPGIGIDGLGRPSVGPFRPYGEPSASPVDAARNRRREELIIRAEDRAAGAYRPTKRIPYT